MKHQHTTSSHGVLPVAITGGTIDPVCGMTVDPKTAMHKADYKGQTYYFCSAGCKTKFQASPTKYLDVGAKTVEPVMAGAIYTCPMHPEINQISRAIAPFAE